jgi:hypothetical protein
VNHGKGGKMSLEKAHMQAASQYFLKAGKEMGYEIRDPNPQGPLTDGNWAMLNTNAPANVTFH